MDIRNGIKDGRLTVLSELSTGDYQQFADEDFPTITELDLVGVQVTEEQLSHLSGLVSLQKLQFFGSITNEGLRHLSGLKNLQELSFFGDEVTDEGLMHLSGLSNLRELHLLGMAITEQGISALQQALPQCKIIWEAA